MSILDIKVKLPNYFLTDFKWSKEYKWSVRSQTVNDLRAVLSVPLTSELEVTEGWELGFDAFIKIPFNLDYKHTLSHNVLHYQTSADITPYITKRPQT